VEKFKNAVAICCNVSQMDGSYLGGRRCVGRV